MNYKEALFFIGKSLTIIDEEKNRNEIKKQIRETNIDWEAIVQLSTAHYVLPAFYCNLKSVGFLKYLPEDLVGFMENITNLNRERNQKLLQEAIELNDYLRMHNIKPIFLKGISHLIGGIYHDIGERMIGDIDFIVALNEYGKTIEMVKKFGYNIIGENLPEYHRHFPTLISKSKIGGVEIHKELIRKKYTRFYNYKHIKDKIIKIKNTYILNYNEQLYYIILSYQVNDFGFKYKTINLRSSYDVYKLHKKLNKKELNNINKKMKTFFNTYLVISNEIFQGVLNIHKDLIKENSNYLNFFNNIINNPSIIKKRMKRIDKYHRISNELLLLFRSLYSTQYRKWLYKSTPIRFKRKFKAFKERYN